MKAQVNLGQILQGGLAALVGWLFKTVNDLQQEVATLKAQVAAYQDSISGFNQNLLVIEEVIREILFKVHIFLGTEKYYLKFTLFLV